MSNGKRLVTAVAAVVVAMTQAAAAAPDAWPPPARGRLERSPGSRPTVERSCGVPIKGITAIARRADPGGTTYRIVALTLRLNVLCRQWTVDPLRFGQR